MIEYDSLVARINPMTMCVDVIRVKQGWPVSPAVTVWQGEIRNASKPLRDWFPSSPQTVKFGANTCTLPFPMKWGALYRVWSRTPQNPIDTSGQIVLRNDMA